MNSVKYNVTELIGSTFSGGLWFINVLYEKCGKIYETTIIFKHKKNAYLVGAGYEIYNENIL